MDFPLEFILTGRWSVSCSCPVTQFCRLFATPWTVARQAPVHGILQAGILELVAIPFSRDLPDPGIKLNSLVPLALTGESFTTGKPLVSVLLFHKSMPSLRTEWTQDMPLCRAGCIKS